MFLVCLSLSSIACLLIALLPGDTLPRIFLGFVAGCSLGEVAWIAHAERTK